MMKLRRSQEEVFIWDSQKQTGQSYTTYCSTCDVKNNSTVPGIETQQISTISLPGPATLFNQEGWHLKLIVQTKRVTEEKPDTISSQLEPQDTNISLFLPSIYKDTVILQSSIEDLLVLIFFFFLIRGITRKR